MTRLFALVVRFWPAVIAVWLIGAWLLWAAAPPFAEVATFDDTSFLGDDAASMQGGMLLAEGWPQDDFSRNAAIVLARPDGELGDDDLDYGRDLVSWLSSGEAPDALGGVTTHLDEPRLRDVFVSQDDQAMFLLVGLEVQPFTPPANEAIAALRSHIEATSPPQGLEVAVTGSAAVAADESAAIDRSVNRTHVITLVLVTLILLAVYRSPVAPLVPLVTIGIAFLVSLSTVSLLAAGGMEVTSLFETFSIVIVFGAGTDYCLFLISRYHEEHDLARSRGFAGGSALRTGTLTATALVLAIVLGSSALTTIAGFSSMTVAQFGMYRTMGPAMAIAVAITLLAALTLTPALMRMFGRWLFWPHLAAPSHGTTGTERPLLESRRAQLERAGVRLPEREETR